VWQKTQGEDHLDHSLLYTLIATKLIGAAVGNPISLPMMTTFKAQRR
jgi:hypothetical protein